MQKNLNRAKVENRQGKGATRKEEDRESGKRRVQRGVIGMGVRVRLRPIRHYAKKIRPARGLIDHKGRVVADQRARTTRPLR